MILILTKKILKIDSKTQGLQNKRNWLSTNPTIQCSRSKTVEFVAL